MAGGMNIKFKTYTPLWSGGAAKDCDRLHETGIVGSMRFWYEVICRGLGIGACDITSNNDQCLLGAVEYHQGVEQGKTADEVLGEQGICAVCRIFGCSGWRRRFQLRVEGAPSVQFSFVSLGKANEGWLNKIFGSDKAFFGDIKLALEFYGGDTEFVKNQIQMLFSFIELFGAVGAKMQYGFGHIHLLEPDCMDEESIVTHMRQLLSRSASSLKDDKKNTYSLSNLITIDCDINEKELKKFIDDNSKEYIPCVFDLKYKGKGFGFRQWLKDKKEWQGSSDARRPKELDLLLGPSSQSVKNDENRLAGRVFFSMPYKRTRNDTVYHLRVFAFALPAQHAEDWGINAEELADLIEEYLRCAFGSNIAGGSIERRYGSDLIKKVREG